MVLKGEIRKIIITGGCGFIGHHFVQHIFDSTDWDIIVLDKLSYASKGLDRLRDINCYGSDRVKVFTCDLCYGISDGIRSEIGNDVDVIVHMAAETHVDNSIKDPVFVVSNNINSTLTILEYARTLPTLKCMFYFSTDEVFGPAPGEVMYKEWDRHRPTNPYSASKSAAEQLCVAYENTYKLPLMTVNVMNAMGERQHVEKFIPLVIKKLLIGDKIIIHSNKDKTKAGTRFYIHSRNIAHAVLFLLENGTIGEKYNIQGEKEVSNLEMAQFIADTIGCKLEYEMTDFHSTRPGHDLRYGIDGSKLYELGWIPPVDFEKSLRNTILWTLENKSWLDE